MHPFLQERYCAWLPNQEIRNRIHKSEIIQRQGLLYLIGSAATDLMSEKGVKRPVCKASAASGLIRKSPIEIANHKSIRFSI
jgi:hypothetical protein